MALEFIKLVKGDSPVAQVGSLGFFKLGVESGGGGGDLTFSRVFSENTPAQISAVSAVISANNMTSAQVEEQFGWKIGDTYPMSIYYQSITFNFNLRIIGFNHETLSDGSGAGGITLEADKVLTTCAYHTSSTNPSGYSTSSLRNTTMPLWKSLLPQEWQNVIKPVDKKSSKAYSSTAVVTTSEELFALSEREVMGTYTNSQNGAKEGKQYEYYANGASPKKTGQSGWWLRSVSNASDSKAVVIYSGSPNKNFSLTSSTSAGVSFAFCV